MLSVPTDAFGGTRYLMELAHIQTAAGEPSLALETLRNYLSLPSNATLPILRRNPHFAPLLDLPDFEAPGDRYWELARRRRSRIARSPASRRCWMSASRQAPVGWSGIALRYAQQVEAALKENWSVVFHLGAGFERLGNRRGKPPRRLPR